MTILPFRKTESSTDGPCAEGEILRRKHSGNMVCDVAIISCLFHRRAKDIGLVWTALLGPGDLNGVGFIRWPTFECGSNSDSSSPDNS